MRWFALILFIAVLSISCAEPEPKKYKPESKDKDRKTNSTLTDDEKQFLKEVEEKFGVKSEVSVKDQKNNEEAQSSPMASGQVKPLPAVIAIEIVNDTETKDKRTIDADLGYGYRTSNGYTYTYFGKPVQDKGKFMIYPYSQEDIPPPRHNVYNSEFIQQPSRKYTNLQNVEIQSSQAYELVPVKDEQSSYQYRKPVTELKTKYENIKGLESPPPIYSVGENSQDLMQTSPPSTLFTTYNGEQFSDLSGQFPTVMPNYFVDPSQLLKNPQYRNVGLTQDHLRSHGPHLEQRVVPVLVLRIPSSYLKNPATELYPNLPQNYPLSSHLNNVNFQELVSQYFKKVGYPYISQMMSPQNSPISVPVESSMVQHAGNYETQQYADPYVQPAYTQTDYSGVQYSGVQPVMAKYPVSNSEEQYFAPQVQTYYQQPAQQQQQQQEQQQQQQPQQQQYEYQYQYAPQSAEQPQTYYDPQQQQYPRAQQTAPIDTQKLHTTRMHTYHHNADVNTQYTLSRQPSSQESTETTSAEYEIPQIQTAIQYVASQPVSHYKGLNTAKSNLEIPRQTSGYLSKKTISQDYSSTKQPTSVYRSAKPPTQYSSPKKLTYTQETSSPKQALLNDPITVYPSLQSKVLQKYYVNPESGASQSYVSQKQVHDDSASKNVAISENYPSKDHTIATVLPFSYKPIKKHNLGAVQMINYVTPVPYSSKYQSQYRVMVPQTVLTRPNPEKVSYVNPQPNHFVSVGPLNSDYNPEEEYTVGSHYIPLVGSQEPPSYPRNYHTHPKRMVKSDNKTETLPKKQKERSEKKKLS